MRIPRPVSSFLKSVIDALHLGLIMMSCPPILRPDPPDGSGEWRISVPDGRRSLMRVLMNGTSFYVWRVSWRHSTSRRYALN